jgi:hypothetical protein
MQRDLQAPRLAANSAELQWEMTVATCMIPTKLTVICFGLLVTLPAGAVQEEVTLDRMVPEYSRCVASIMQREAANFVLSHQALGAAKARKPMTSRCSYVFAGDETVDFIASWYRDELAVALLKEEYADKGPVSFADRGELVHPKAPVQGDPRFVYQKQEYNNFRPGECVARLAPEAVRSWAVASADAVRDLPSATIDSARRACSRTLAATFTGDATRGPIARGYYRLAHAPFVDPAP